MKRRKRMNKGYFVFFCLLFLSLGGYAQIEQEVEDSVIMDAESKKKWDEIKRQKEERERLQKQENAREQARIDSLAAMVDTAGFDARRFIGQKRFIPENQSFIEKNSWSDHLFFSLSGGLSWVDQSRNKRTLTEGSRGHFYIGKEFTSIHGMRLGFGFNSFVEQESKQDLMNYVFRADYLCNFSSMRWKYNPKRFMDVVGVWGLSYYRTSLGETKSKAYGMNLGLQFLFKAGSNTAITLEPSLSFASDGYDLLKGGGRHKMHTAYGVEVGLKYTFTDVNFSWPCDTGRYLLKNTFLEMSTGAATYGGNDIGFSRSLGNAYTLSLGKWLTPGIGVKLSAALAETRWKEAVSMVKDSRSYIYEELQGHGGLRVEALINPMGFGNVAQFDRNAFFEVNLAAGGEMGWLVKTDFDTDGKKQFLKCNYLGLTGGLQFLFRPWDDFAFFLEPRVTVLNYDIPYENRPNLSEKYSDEVYGLNVGFRMSAPARSSCNKEKKVVAEVMESSPFIPYSYVSLDGGLSTIWQNKRYKDAASGIGWTGGVSGGYRFSPYLGVRLGASLASTGISGLYDYVEYVSSSEGLEVPFRYRGLWNRHLHQYTISANLEVNLSNLYMGYDRNRCVDVSLFLGPAFSGITDSSDQLADVETSVGHSATIIGSSPRAFDWGLEGAVAVSARISEHLRLSLRPQLNIYSRDFVRSSINAGRWMGIVTTRLGVEYQF